MWWLLQNCAQFLYYSLLDFVFFIIVDAFAKFTIGDASTKSVKEKKIIWFWESVALLWLCLVIYLCDHVPYLLIALSTVTFIYTQLAGSVNLYQWWIQMKTRWEEHQQHQDSMSRMQVQMAIHKQQEQNLQQNRLKLSTQEQFTRFNVPQIHPLQTTNQQLHANNIFTTTTAAVQKNKASGLYKSVLSKVPKVSLFQQKNMEDGEPGSRPPLKSQEFSFMPSLSSKASFGRGQHFATNNDDSPVKKTTWFGENLMRKPIRSTGRIPYSPPPSDNDSLRHRIMSKFGFLQSDNLPSGLRNEGQNLCFINGIVQCLARTPGLLSELETEASYKDSDCSMAESLFINTLTELLQSCNMTAGSRKAVLDPIAFRQAASSLNPNLVAPPPQRQSQQDAAELFMWLMECLHSIINKNRKARTNDKPVGKESGRMKMMKFIYGDLSPAKVQDLKVACKQEIDAANGLMNDSYAEPVQRLSDLEWMSYKKENCSVVDNLFTGQMVIAYHCLADNHISVNMQTFNILPVPIEAPREVNGLVILNDCFRKFCNIEHLVGQDGLECSFCNARRIRQQVDQVGRPASHTSLLKNSMLHRTPNMNGRQTKLSSVDSAISGVNSPLSSNFMSPIPGTRDVFSDSGFQDNVFKTSTPISEPNQISHPQRIRDAERRCSLRQLPDCLVIQLMRFSYNPFTRQTNKIHAPVSIPLRELDLTEVMFDTITNREDLTEEDAVYKYNLYGLCCHIGADSANFGHYVSYCLHSDDKWYKFDDERVTEIDMEYELTTRDIRQNAYLLFYKKS